MWQAELFLAAQASARRRRAVSGVLDPVTVHRHLRDALLPSFPLLERPPPRRISPAERSRGPAAPRRVRGAGRCSACPSPGLVLALLVPAWATVGLSALAALAVAARLDWLRDLREELRPSAAPRLGVLAALALALGAYLAALSAAGGTASRC